jgi:hypothetical protein
MKLAKIFIPHSLLILAMFVWAIYDKQPILGVVAVGMAASVLSLYLSLKINWPKE